MALLADAQIAGDLRDARSRYDDVEDLATELRRITLGQWSGPPSYGDQ
jgi:hypothetical protein